MNFPIEFYDVLNCDLFDAVIDELDSDVWGLNNASEMGLSKAWGMKNLMIDYSFSTLLHI